MSVGFVEMTFGQTAIWTSPVCPASFVPAAHFSPVFQVVAGSASPFFPGSASSVAVTTRPL